MLMLTPPGRNGSIAFPQRMQSKSPSIAFCGAIPIRQSWLIIKFGDLRSFNKVKEATMQRVVDIFILVRTSRVECANVSLEVFWIYRMISTKFFQPWKVIVNL